MNTDESSAEAEVEPALRIDITDMCVLLGNPRVYTTMRRKSSSNMKSLKNIAET